VHRTPQAVFLASTLISLLDFVALFTAAERDGVLNIPSGVGLLQEHGLLSMILGNCFVPVLVRLYYDAVQSMPESKAVKDETYIKHVLATLSSMVELKLKSSRFLYFLVLVGSLYWLANVGVHIFGNPELRWGHKVFDSTNHPLSFWASRLHNLYTWLVLLPVCAHVAFFASLQLRRAVLTAFDHGQIFYV
jgi:hypothetical protein